MVLKRCLIKKEKMDDQFLKPLENMEKAKPSNALYGQIEAALFDHKVIPMPTIALVAASILLLLFVDIYAVNNTQEDPYQESTFVDDSQLINNFQFY